jgi:hypothetical protein
MMGCSSLAMITTTRTHVKDGISTAGSGRTFVHAILLLEIINSRPLVRMTRVCDGRSDTREYEEMRVYKRK